jgi:hypothetical protein
MCKSAAYNSKLLEGYSLARFAYESKYFSAKEDKDEKKKKYKLIDKVTLDVINMIKSSTVPILCLVRFDFSKKEYQKLLCLNPSINRSLLYNRELPKTFKEVFNNGKFPNMSIKDIKDQSSEYILDDKSPTDTTINAREPFVSTASNLHIIGKEFKKLNSDYYFYANKMSNTKKLLDKACQTSSMVELSDKIYQSSPATRYLLNLNNRHVYEIVTVEEYIRRGMEEIVFIRDRELDEIDISYEGMDYPPDGVDDFYRLFCIRMSDSMGWSTMGDFTNYTIGEANMTFNEVVHYNDVFVATIYGFAKGNTIYGFAKGNTIYGFAKGNTSYNISEKYHSLGEWMINRYLYNVKESLRSHMDIDDQLMGPKELGENYIIDHDKIEHLCSIGHRTEYIDNKGKPRYINHLILFRLCNIYAITPYQMEFINSGKYEIIEGLMPDFTYYDSVLEHFGITKEQLTGELINQAKISNSPLVEELDYFGNSIVTGKHVQGPLRKAVSRSHDWTFSFEQQS